MSGADQSASAKPTVAFIALGSNLGDRRLAIDRAVALLAADDHITISAISPLFETAPVGGPPGQGPFLNAACEVRTTRSARGLLDRLLSIEAALGRERRVRWGPRLIDLDLLLFGDEVHDEPGLRIPHPRLHERLFVLEPLAAIAPRAVHPVLGRSIAALLEAARAADRTGDLDGA